MRINCSDNFLRVFNSNEGTDSTRDELLPSLHWGDFPMLCLYVCNSVIELSMNVEVWAYYKCTYVRG